MRVSALFLPLDPFRLKECLTDLVSLRNPRLYPYLEYLFSVISSQEGNETKNDR